MWIWRTAAILGLVTGGWGLGAEAAEVLFDFSTPRQVDAWKLPVPEGSRLSASDRFATPGTKSLLFETRKWQPGMPQWPAFETKFEPIDVTPYDRLVVEVVNASDQTYVLQMLMADSKVDLRAGLRANATLNPLSRHQFVVDLSETNPAEVRRINLRDVNRLHMWVRAPQKDVEFYIDRIYLLKPQEALLEADPAVVRESLALLKSSQGLRDAEQLLSEVGGWIEGTDDKEEKAWLREVRVQVEERLEAVRNGIQAAPELGEAERAQLFVDLSNLSHQRDRVASIRGFRSEYLKTLAQRTQDGEDFWKGVGVGTASSAQRVMPRDVALPSSVSPVGVVEVELARNESEGFQVVVLPFASDLSGLRVEVGELKDREGNLLQPGRVSSEVVGYVKTYRPQHPLAEFGQYVGWWPDPMLPFLDAVDVEAGDSQSFFVRVQTEAETAAGEYTGQVRVSSEGSPTPYLLDLRVTVHDFALPDASPLPVAMAFDQDQMRIMAMKAEPGLTTEAWEERWSRLKFVWADFLADHFVNYDHLYANAADWPDFEVLDHLHEQGRLGRFNLGHYGTGQTKELDQIETMVQKQLPNILRAYEQAQSRGWLDKAYIYGFDERPKASFPMMEAYTERMRQDLPGVTVMTTAGAYWDYWGEAEGIDIWSPIIGKWDEERVRKYKDLGQEVWWYVCIASPPPYPNVFIDMDVIDTRVLMGAMTSRFRPDGFLYYKINNFNRVPTPRYNTNTRYIDSGPFTTWNPKSFMESHGDGNLTYPGPGGVPLPNLRLENFRDGLEDFAYTLELEREIERVEASTAQSDATSAWLRDAKALVAVPAEVVKSTTSFTKDPAVLASYRSRVAGLITSAP